ncbi:type II secretion system protein GspH [Salinicola corii]|uniref:Type II secretion system protein H n=1 Tax=Salinicola corii TaxID=2606937 RepID=A0A640WHW9_9GAMM|nr:GspH/FimT family pseudopilin [Salinicola corii]KAA0019908.1 type II secretion system protein GspH [Salinicola corii]
MNPCPHASRQAGVTLLELLVVIVIIALAATLSVAWLGGGEPARLRSSVEQLQSDMRLAGDIAFGQQRIIGWRPGIQGYRFVTWRAQSNGGEWVPLNDDGELPDRSWSQPVTATRVPPAADDAAPWLIWWPNGEVTGGELTLHSGQDQMTLHVDALAVRLADDSMTESLP